MRRIIISFSALTSLIKGNPYQPPRIHQILKSFRLLYPFWLRTFFLYIKNDLSERRCSAINQKSKFRAPEKINEFFVFLIQKSDFFAVATQCPHSMKISDYYIHFSVRLLYPFRARPRFSESRFVSRIYERLVEFMLEERRRNIPVDIIIRSSGYWFFATKYMFSTTIHRFSTTILNFSTTICGLSTTIYGFQQPYIGFQQPCTDFGQPFMVFENYTRNFNNPVRVFDVQTHVFERENDPPQCRKSALTT